MKEVAVRLLDDLDLADGTRTEADGTVQLQLNDQLVELDLTSAHITELAIKLAPYFKAGHKQGQGAGTRPGRKPKAYYDGLHEYATSRGITLERKSDGSGWAYPLPLRREYDEHLAAG